MGDQINSTHDMTNRMFGDFQIIRRIGGGAMAEVFLAEQKSLSRQVALKILKAEHAQDENGVKRFVREAKAAARLVHPNIVHIYEVNSSDGIWFIAQEYVQGTNLHILLNRLGSFPPNQVVHILWQVASALHKATQEGIVHRDIKPDNILVSDSGEIKVADFGLAYMEKLAGEKSANLTQTGMTLGTPLYMSPEQAEGKVLDYRSDIYSLGITAYHLLTGSPPFQGDTALATVLQHINKQPASLQESCPNIPAAFAELVHKMIAKSPDNRQQTIPELLDELKQISTEYFPDDKNDASFLNWKTPLTGLPVSKEGQDQSVTIRLQKTMELESITKRKNHKGIYLVAACLCGALLLGMIAAYSRIQAQTLILPPPIGTEAVPKQNSVAEQWIFACRIRTEEGWKSVIAYFPESQKTFWERKMKQQLALLYMKNDEREKAFDIFQEFADMTELEPHARAFGYAGFIWYYAKQGDKQMTLDAFYDFSMQNPSNGFRDEPTNNVFIEAMRIYYQVTP